MLDIEKSCLVVVDVQGKLAQLMYERDTLFKNVQILIKAAKILNIPILWCQQCPEALGETVTEISELLNGLEPINKACFSCCGDPQFNSELEKTKRSQIILCGMETHVCIYQTITDLLVEHKEVVVVADAVSSRTQENKKTGLGRIAAEGGKIASVEMALFELLKTAEHPDFRQIAKLIK